MGRTVQIVVTCTKRKTTAPHHDHCLRSVPRGTVTARAAEWLKRLRMIESNRVAVRDLYAGDHWSVARTLEDSSQTPVRRVWVCSAGYGMLQMDDRVKSYSATFSRRHPDSVYQNCTSPDVDLAATWWNKLSEGAKLAGRPVRRLVDVAAESPRSPLIVVASENYLRAIRNELCEALTALNRPNLLTIISAGGTRVDDLKDHFLPFDARLQGLVGGALRSLNMRVARRVLEECARSVPTLDLLTARVEKWLVDCPERPRYDRRAMSDDEVIQFVLESLAEDSTARPSPLLRQLRDGGSACEYKRFMGLFHRAAETINGR